jgi:hypothetical protein
MENKRMKQDSKVLPCKRILFKRGIEFRLMAVMLGLGVVLLIEGLLRLTNIGRIQDGGDPYVGFNKVIPLFVLNDTGDKYEISPSRLDFFHPDSFSAKKSDKEFRIFCLGGSTVQGNPYTIETSFTTWLELSLRAADLWRHQKTSSMGQTIKRTADGMADLRIDS